MCECQTDLVAAVGLLRAQTGELASAVALLEAQLHAAGLVAVRGDLKPAQTPPTADEASLNVP